MVGVRFQRDALVSALRTVGKVRPWQRDERTPALTRIAVADDQAAVISTSLDMQIEVLVACDASVEQSLVAPITTFTGFVEKLPGGCEVEITPSDTGIVVRGGKSRSTLTASSINALPARDPSTSTARVMPAARLAAGLNAAVPASIDDAKRPYLGGVYLHDSEAGLRFEAQDGARIHATRQDGARIHASAIIPQRSARIIADLLPSDGDAEIAISERSAEIVAGDLRITCALLGGSFPPIEPQLAAATNRTLRANAADLLADIDLVMTVADLRNRDFRLDLGATCEASAFRVLGGGPEMGAVALNARFEGAPLAIGFQFPLVRDALQLFGAADIDWRMGGPEDPTIISSPHAPGVEALVSPFRLVAEHQRKAA